MVKSTLSSKRALESAFIYMEFLRTRALTSGGSIFRFGTGASLAELGVDNFEPLLLYELATDSADGSERRVRNVGWDD